MSAEIGQSLHQSFREESLRFDHFVVGATMAVCAYLVQTNPYEQLGFNLGSMYLFSLVVLGSSAIMGFKRIDAMILLFRLNASVLEKRANKLPGSPEPSWSELDKVVVRAVLYYRLQHGLLIGGFLSYLLTKLASTYMP